MLRQRLQKIEEQRKQDEASRADLGLKLERSSPFTDLLNRLIKASNLDDLIASSAIKTKPTEIVVIAGLLGCVGLLLGFLTPKGFLGIILSIAMPIAFAYSPIYFLQYKAKKRRQKFDEKFPEALGLMARALQAGSGLTSALGMAANELPDPCGTEFKKAFDEINFGISFNDAISSMAARVKSADLNFFVTALVIQRETGGNLAELLQGLGHTIRERQKLSRKVQIISAEGRLSGNVLISLPFIMIALLTLINPGYVELLWSTEAGQSSVTAGLIMMGVGAILIRRIVTIKV